MSSYPLNGPASRPGAEIVRAPDPTDGPTIPAELRERGQWVVWRSEVRGKDKPTKVLYQARRPKSKAKVNDPTTWATFEEVRRAVETHPDLAGIGYVFAEDDPFTGIDLDNCLRADGQVEEWARPHLAYLTRSYGEISPSGRGIKFVVRGRLTGKGKRRNGYGDGSGAIEVYDRGRFFTITGDVWDHEHRAIVAMDDDLAALYDEVQQRPAKPTAPKPAPARRDHDGRPHPLSRASDYLAKVDPAISGQKGHDRAFYAACKMVEFGLSPDQAFHLLWTEYNPRCDPRWTEAELRHKVEDAFQENADRHGAKLIEDRDNRTGRQRKAPAPENDGQGQDPDDRPGILVDHRLHLAVDASIKAIADDPNIFQRGPILVRVVRDIAKQARREPDRPPNTPLIAPVSLATMRETMTRRADYAKLRRTRDGDYEAIPAVPPDTVVSAVLARGQWSHVRPIEGIVEAPTLRPDGSILDKPGWDPETGLLYEPNRDDFPAIKARPTHDDAKQAAGRLLALVKDFPFADESHAAAWLSALLTPLARFAIEGPTPLFLFDANTPGSGKTLLVDLIAAIATGRIMARSAYTPDDDEMRKSIIATAIAGDRMTLFDNVETGFSVGGASLDGALTSESVKGRILGKSENAEVPWKCVLFATGNNIGLRGDALRRVVPCRLDSPEERPEERDDFEIPNLLAHVRRERPRLVAAALTILRAYVVADRPKQKLPPLGSYDAWCVMVRESVHWACGHDPCEPRKELRQSDTETASRAALVAGWAALCESEGKDSLTTTEAVQALGKHEDGHEELRAVLSEWSRDGGLPTTRVIGNRLNKIRGRATMAGALEFRFQKGIRKWFVKPPARGVSGASGASVPAVRGGTGSTNVREEKESDNRKRNLPAMGGTRGTRGTRDTPPPLNGEPADWEVGEL